MSQLPNCIASPPWLQRLNWIIDPIGFLDKHRRKYGDIFTMQLSGLRSCVLIGDPQAIQEIFKQDANFDTGRGVKLMEPLLGKNSLVLMDGERHQKERKLLMPPFHGERLKSYAQQICLITEKVTSQWQIGQTFVVRDTMQKITLEVIMQVVFGLRKGKRYQQLQPLLTDWLNMLDSPVRSSILFFRFLQQDWGEWTPWGRMKQRQRQIHNLLQEEIEDRRINGNEERTDILSLMMAARDENGQAMTDEELRDELLTILFGGHETTATTLAWAFYQIHRQPDICKKLRQELDSIGQNSDPLKTAQLPYLIAVCQEVLRMYPLAPVMSPRITKSPIKIAGYLFESETTLLPTSYLVHYREDLYPNAQSFEPERFLERQYSPSEYCPFGGGSRLCLGYALAQLEIKLVLATILSNYQLALSEDKPVKFQRRGLMLTPQGGIEMVMTGKR